MNNSKDESMDKMNINSAGDRIQSNPDPIVQERDYSDKPRKEKQTSEIVLAPEEAIAVPRGTAWPSPFIGTSRPAPAAPLSSDIISSLLRFKWTILIVFLLVSAPILAFIWTQIVPKYRARAELRVRPSLPRLVFRTDENGAIPLYDSFVNTQVSIIRGPTVLQRVLDQTEVKKTQWYKNPQKSLLERLHGNTVPPLERLRDTLSVQPRRRTEIIDISFVDANALDAKAIVKEVQEQYIQYIGKKSNEDEDKLYDQLVEEYNSLEKNIRGREEGIAVLQEKIKTDSPQELIASRRLRLDETEARLNEIRQNIDDLEWKKALMEDTNDVTLMADSEMQPKYEEDAEWQKRDIDVRTLRHQIANSGLTPKHPDMARMEKNLEFAEELLRLREAQLDKQWSGQPQDDVPGAPTTVAQWRDQSINVLPITQTKSSSFEEEWASVKFLLKQEKRKEENLVEYYNTQQKEFENLFATAQLLEKENNDLKHQRDLFEVVRQQLDQKNVESNVREVIAKIEVLTPAFVSSQPYSDRRIVFSAMVLMMGLGMGGGVAFLRASKNQTVYTLRDMPYSLQAPFLGHIPVIYAGRSQRKSVKKSPYDGKKDESTLIESVRQVRTALLTRLSHQSSAVVLITSANPGTGKSHFTMKLGESFARAGKKVLMIDADLRKRTLTQRFNLFGKTGFVESLHSRSADKRNIYPTDTFGLNIMPAGAHNDDGSVFEETANGAFKNCMAQLRQWYDIILLDSPPIMPVADATILSSQVDGTIMVERELVSRQESQIDALTRLISSGGQLLGTVFVSSSDRKDSGYQYAYGKA